MNIKKRVLIVLCLLLFFLGSSNVFAANATYTPAEPTLINGQPEGSTKSKQDVIALMFVSYKPKSKKHIDKFKKIVSIKYKNKTKQTQKYTAKVTQSSSKGASWSGSLSFTGEIKAGILGGVKTQLGTSVKTSRSKNEAKGFSTTVRVSPKHVGTCNIYYRGWKSFGKLKCYSFYTATPNKRIYITRNVNVTVFASKYLDIYSNVTEKKL